MLEPAQMSKHVREVLTDALRGNCWPCADEAAFLLYLLDRGTGREKLAATLSSSVPVVRQRGACFLALMGEDWCLETLIRAASGPAETGGHEAACALSL